MANSRERLDAMFPKLTHVQIDRLRPFGRERRGGGGGGGAERGAAERAVFLPLARRGGSATPAPGRREKGTNHQPGGGTAEGGKRSGRRGPVARGARAGAGR